MIYKYKLIVILILSGTVKAQQIKFKDVNLKLALIEQGYDFNKDNEIQISEIDTVTKLKIDKRNIGTLDDLIYFRRLKILNAMKNQITNLDVFSNNSLI